MRWRKRRSAGAAASRFRKVGGHFVQPISCALDMRTGQQLSVFIAKSSLLEASNESLNLCGVTGVAWSLCATIEFELARALTRVLRQLGRASITPQHLLCPFPTRHVPQ